MTVIPDSIEPVEAWRTWRLSDGKLVSLTNDATWEPGQPLKADCFCAAERYVWTLRRRGLNREGAARLAEQHNQQASMVISFSRKVPDFVSTPQVEPPPGYGYSLEAETHDAPHEGCTCGVYAAAAIDDCPAGEIAGKVKLWGTVIPGERGFRAEYAYPSELHVPPELRDDAGLLAYGVPVVEMSPEFAQRCGTMVRSRATVNISANSASFAAALSKASQNMAAFNWSMGDLPRTAARTCLPWQLKFAVALNLAAVAVNLAAAFKVFHV